MSHWSEIEKQLLLFLYSETLAKGRQWAELKRWDFAYGIDKSFEDSNKSVDNLIHHGYIECASCPETSGLRYSLNQKYTEKISELRPNPIESR